MHPPATALPSQKECKERVTGATHRRGLKRRDVKRVGFVSLLWTGVCHPVRTGRRWQSRPTRGARKLGLSRANHSRHDVLLASARSPLAERHCAPAWGAERPPLRYESTPMILHLRRRHRQIVCTLAFALPVLLATGIAARRPVPIANSLPASLSSNDSHLGRVLWSRTDLWPSQESTSILRDDPVGFVAIGFVFHGLLKPDVLVYWTAAQQTAGDRLPADARLFGALVNGKTIPVPADVRGKTGRLILYSLAEHEVVATSESFSF